MVLVRGLDRLDGTALEGMSDELWAEHTAELQARFEAQQGQDGALGFTEFCAQFAELGGLSTAAMGRHHRHFGGDGGDGPTAPAPAPQLIGGRAGLGPRWTRGEIERPAGERNMGTWTAAVYTPEQQLRLGVDEMGEPTGAAPPPGIGANMPPPAPGQFVIVDTTGGGGGGDAEARREQMRLAAERRVASQRAAAEHRAQQAAARQPGPAGDDGLSFPDHWGAPPAEQTEDIRALPGGFGEGSSTLAAWIEQKMELDAVSAMPAAGAAVPVPGKQSWPELVGTAGEAAVATIRGERPDLAQVLTVPEDAMVTMDWREDRVRVFVDAAGNAAREPQCG
jgi:hypothetical protein